MKSKYMKYVIKHMLKQAQHEQNEQNVNTSTVAGPQKPKTDIEKEQLLFVSI